MFFEFQAKNFLVFWLEICEFFYQNSSKFKHCEKSHEKGGESLVKFGYNFAYEKND